jgi:hypothetical protein
MALPAEQGQSESDAVLGSQGFTAELSSRKAGNSNGHIYNTMLYETQQINRYSRQAVRQTNELTQQSTSQLCPTFSSLSA